MFKAIRDQDFLVLFFCSEGLTHILFLPYFKAKENNAVHGYLAKSYFRPKHDTTSPLKQLHFQELFAFT